MYSKNLIKERLETMNVQRIKLILNEKINKLKTF